MVYSLRRLLGLGMGFSLLATSGCAAPQPMPKGVVEKFVGQPLSIARAAWGEPVGEEPLEAGAERITWAYEGARVSRTGHGAPQQQGPFLKPPKLDLPELVIERCRLEFLVNEAGLIESWSAEGPACMYALTRPELWPR